MEPQRIVRPPRSICLHCFGTLDGTRVCTNCHKKADDIPAPPHHLMTRTVLADKYLIVRALGEGGFGITYLAWDMNSGKQVAIKEYYPSGYVNRMPHSNQVIINSKQNQAASNRGLKRFIDEAKTLAKIKNLPGIVSVRDFFSANGTAYIVMEYLDGISLKKYLQRKGGKVPCDEILTILRPVMESLVSVHNLGLIHRDISPDNIIVTKNSQVKLIDFGAAKQSNLDGKSLSIVLKQGFAPEEQYRTHGEQGPWTDIYALGVTIYYAVTGTLPPESIQRLHKDTIVRPAEKGAIITPPQESALMKSLAVYAKHRYQDITQMINGLYGTRRAEAARAAVAAKQNEINGRSSLPPTSPSVSRPAPTYSQSRPAQSVSQPAPSISQPAQSVSHPAPSVSRPTSPSYSRPSVPTNTNETVGSTSVTRSSEHQTTGQTIRRTTTFTRERKNLFERLFGKKKK